MSNHLGDTNKMVSDTPRTDEVNKYLRTRDEYAKAYHEVSMNHGVELERAFNRACKMYRKLDIHALNLIDRIRRLESAGDSMEKLLPEGSIYDKAVDLWRKAKEDKL